MYQFLCADANMPPPYLEIHWRHSSTGSFDEMEMEDMFDRQTYDGEEGGGGGGGDEDFYMYEDDDENNEGDGVWTFNNGTSAAGSAGASSNMTGPSSGTASIASSYGRSSQGGMKSRLSSRRNSRDYQEDGFDIQSLSKVTGEFMYNGTSTNDMTLELSEDQEPGEGGSHPKKLVNLESFNIIRVIGKGSFGKVFLVRHKAQKTLHALKVLKKDFIIRKNQVEHTKTERSVLGYARHPYIVGLTMAFQTADKLFFVLDYCAGGELFFHLGKMGRFPEDRAKFYAAQITLALEYVHKLGVIYRDLKPENVLLDHKGNIRLTDFGLSKEGVRGHSSGASSFCGTPEYIAPEVLKRQGHGRAVDWWSLGALSYEMISGLPPFYSRNRDTMFDKIMKADIMYPAFMSDAAKDLLSKLLLRDPKERLGSGETDADEIKVHPFFEGTDWKQLQEGNVTPPWAPKVAGSLDTSQFDEEFTGMVPVVSPGVRDAYFGSLDREFEGFTFVDEGAAEQLRSHMAAGSMPTSGNLTAALSGSMGGMAGSIRSGAGATLMATSLKKR